MIASSLAASGIRARVRNRLKEARKRGALWVRALDTARLLTTSERRSLLWTRIVHAGDVHQSTPFTCEDRYPELFDLAAKLAPGARRIHSFGCSTGEELLAIRRRFPEAEIVGYEINARSRRIAAERVKADRRIAVVEPKGVLGSFDVVFALAVLQREPHKIAEMGVEDLKPYYPFERFDNAVGRLAASLTPNGLLCVFNAQYRVEDSSAASQLEALRSPLLEPPLFGPDGRILAEPRASSIFRRSSAGN